MITKMLVEIFQAIIDDPTVRRLLGNYGFGAKSDIDLETMMDELELDPAEREKFRKAYREYQQDPQGSYDRYKYKYEPKSDNPFDKFDSYYQKFEDWANETEEKFGKGTGDYRHREYAKYRQQYSGQSQQGQTNGGAINNEERKHYETLEIKPGVSFDEIKAAYKNAMKKYHPDRFTDTEKKKYAETISAKINVAYDYFKKKFNKT